MTSTNNKISALISSQSPFFVRNDHPNFIRFLEAYFEYLEQYTEEGKVVERAKSLRSLADIDSTTDEFAEYLYSKFLKDFPIDVLTDRKTILKRAKDLYRAKGTEKATRFLMRALFNKEIEFYYPKKDVLRASDGKWYIKKSLRITNTSIDGVSNTDITGLEKYVGTRIRGATSNAQAVIESVDRFYDTGTTIDEIELSNISGEFENGENISTTYIESNTTHQLVSEVFGATINTITVTNAGAGYSIGDPVIIESSTGNGASAIVGRVSTGNIASMVVLEGGAGFRVSDELLILGGGGSGATGNVATVLDDGSVHPNSYNILVSLISAYSNTIMANVSSNTINSFSTSFTYSNTGPARSLNIITAGNNYTAVPSIGIVANTRIQELGILGKLTINSGGTGYAIGNTIEFNNGPFSYGVGASANVSNVDANGSITAVRFTQNSGYPLGGFGYSQDYLPTTNVVTGTGSGANIGVTYLLGYGGTFSITNSNLGAVERIIVLDRGSGYTSVPTINLRASGDGTANAIASLVQGYVTYPGRYLNDDGHISSFNFLQDRDYYQNYSYVIRIEESIDKYRKIVKDLLHPAGMKLFGEYLKTDQNVHGNVVTTDQLTSNIGLSALLTGTQYWETPEGPYLPSVYSWSASTATGQTTPFGVDVNTATEYTGTGSGTYFGAGPLTIVSGNSYTQVVIIRKGNFPWMRMTMRDGGFSNRAEVWYDMANSVVGSIGTVGAGLGYIANTAAISNVGSDYRMIRASFTAPNTIYNLNLYPASGNGGATRPDIGLGVGNNITWTVAGVLLYDRDRANTLLVPPYASQTNYGNDLIKYKSGTYGAVYGNVSIRLTSHGQVIGNTVHLEFMTGNTTANAMITSNISNGKFIVTSVANSNYFYVKHNRSIANTSGNVSVGINN